MRLPVVHPMRLLVARVLGAAVLVTAVAPAYAVLPHGTGAPASTARIAATTLAALPAAHVARPLRVMRAVTVGVRPSAAWRAFTTRAGGAWSVSYDDATGVAAQIWGEGIAVAGASASPAIAEAAARLALAQNLELLAPGAAVTDFELVTNVDDGEIRTLGFVQRAGGHRVIGGQVSFRFKRDRLFVIASQALPRVATAGSQQRARLDRADLAARATTALRAALALPAAPVTPPGDEVILPLVGDAGVLGYRVVVPIVIDGGVDGKYLAYVDPASGEPIAVEQQNQYETARVLYRGVERYPGGARLDRPAAGAHVLLNDVATTVAADGTVTVDAPTTVVTAVEGELVKVVDRSTIPGQLAVTLPIAPGVDAVWDESASPPNDARLVTYTSVVVAKEYVRAQLDPTLPFLDQQLTANVNIDAACNAFFDGTSLNFFRASGTCENTGRLADVVYHEFGHGVHAAEVMAGVGVVEPGMGEGVADFLAASITGDPRVGPGFKLTDQPIRDIDPSDSEALYPQGVGEVHITGLIFSGVFWDLRTAAIRELGADAGIALTNKLYLAAIRRGIDIPSTFVEVLAADDDDGDLANGTPHECLIRAAYARHGMRTFSGTVTVPAFAPADTTVPVRVALADLSPRCPAVDTVDHVTLIWKPSPQPGQPMEGEAKMTMVDPLHYEGVLPLPVQAPLAYQARVKFSDGSLFRFPDNYADRYYQLYRGDTVPLYCTTFDDTDPVTDGWTLGGTTAESAFEWGAPTGAGATDPKAPFSGAKIIAQNLAGDYSPDAQASARMPTIEVGTWSDVRLQYRRWLATEDSHFDHAHIVVNDQVAWSNATADNGDGSALAHVDKEWRFQDLPLSYYNRGEPLRIEFTHDSDPGLQFGGWALDDVCVVANVHSICGDGERSPTEACDDAAQNANVPNACRTWCALPACGDGILDDHEQCDVGAAGDADCSSTCQLIPHLPPPDGGGCCSTGTGAVTDPSGTGAATGLALVMGAVLARRRRHRRR